MAQNLSDTNVPSKNKANTKVIISKLGDFYSKIHFSDPEVGSFVNRIIGSLINAVYHSNASIIDTLKFLLGAALEISIQYNPIPADSLIAFSVGDVVDCKFGTHVDGEISGMHVHSIVCDIQDDGTVYLLPITKQILDGDGKKYLLARANQDISYYNPKFNGGTVLLRMGKYVRPERIRIIVGKTSPDFFQHLLQIFHHSMDFSYNLPAYNGLFNNGSVPSPIDVVSGTEAVPEKKPKKIREKKISFEAYMENFLAPFLSSINEPDFSLEDKVSFLLSELKFNDQLAVVHDAFVVSCEVPRVTITSIIAALSKIHLVNFKEILMDTLYTSYEHWIAQQHPEILENYPDTSIMTMLKIFSKKMK